MDEDIFQAKHAGCLDILHVKLVEQVKISLYSPAREVSRARGG